MLFSNQKSVIFFRHRKNGVATYKVHSLKFYEIQVHVLPLREKLKELIRVVNIKEKWSKCLTKN